MNEMEQTLSIIKPDAVERNLTEEIKKIFIENNLKILNSKKIHISKEEASEFAISALELSKITEPQFNRHKTVGLIKAKSEQLNRLERIKEKKSLVTTTAINNSGLGAKLKNIFKK